VSAVKMTDSKKKNTNTMKITTKTIASIINGELDPADYDLCWTINNELMEWTNTSYSKSAGGRFASDDIRFVWSEINKDYIQITKSKPRFKAGTYEDYIAAVHLEDMTGGTAESYRLAEKLKLTHSHWCDFCECEVPTYSEIGWKPDGCFICGGSVIPNKDLDYEDTHK